MRPSRVAAIPRRYLGLLLRLLFLILLALPRIAGTTPAQAATAPGDLLGGIPVVDENALNNAACGVAAAAMVLDYYRQQTNPAAMPLDLTTVVQYVQQYSRLGKVVGTTTDQLKDGIEQASQAPTLQVGRTLTAIWKMTDQTHWFTALQSELDQKRPVIAYLADGHTVWPSQNWHYGHYIVVSGYTSGQSIIYHDPWDGKMHTLSNADFGRAWGTTWQNNPSWWYLRITESAASGANPFLPASIASLPVGYIATYAGSLDDIMAKPTTVGMVPEDVAVAAPNLLLIADTGNQVVWLANLSDQTIMRYGREILPGRMAVVAGSGSSIYSGDGGQATEAGLNPDSVAVDADGNLYIGDARNYRVRKVGVRTGIITTVAGNGQQSYSGDGGPAIDAGLGPWSNGAPPESVSVDAAGNLYIGSNGNVRKVSAGTGIISTVVGHSDLDCDVPSEDLTAINPSPPVSVAVSRTGDLYFASIGWSCVRMVAAGTDKITTIAGVNSHSAGDGGDGGPALQAGVSPSYIALDTAGNLYLTETGYSRVRKVTAASGLISGAAGNGITSIKNNDYGHPVGTYSGDQGPAIKAGLNQPEGLAVDPSGNVYIADTGNDRIRMVAASTGAISSVAGSGAVNILGDGMLATQAGLNGPSGLAVDAAGNLYIADSGNNRVRKVAANTGIITTVAGDGQTGYSGDNGAATQAELNQPTGIAVDAAGNLYIADSGNNCIRKVVVSTGIITTIAGTGKPSYSGDNGPATRAELSDPTGVAVDPTGNLYIADYGNGRVRKVSKSNGIITTVAGNGQSSDSGNGEPATRASLGPIDVTLDAAGNLYIADYGGVRIRKVAAGTGNITTVAGNGIITANNFGAIIGTFGGDGGPATKAGLSEPTAVAVDPTGNLYIADSGNARIRKVVVATGVITSVVGDGRTALGGDDGPAMLAALNNLVGDVPSCLAFDRAGDLFISDTSNNRVRVVRGIAGPEH